MLSYILSFFGKKVEEDINDTYKDNFLADQLVELELANNYEEQQDTASKPSLEIPANATCFQRTGLVTYMDANYILIDGMLYFDTSSCSLTFSLNDQVLYLGYKDSNDSIIVVRILENCGMFWGDEEKQEENKFSVIEHTIISEVSHRENRLVYLKDSDLKFSLDGVESSFVPIKGDWLELMCSVQWDDDKPSVISAAHVLDVISIKALRKKIKKAVITDWYGECGTCDRIIYFDKSSLYESSAEVQAGAKVMVEAIESNQGTCSWRALKLMIIENAVNENNQNKANTQPEETLDLEHQKNIEVTFPLKFEKVDFHKTRKMMLTIRNNSDEVYIINKWIMLSRKRDSQVDVKPFITQPVNLQPKQTFCLKITCYPKFLGNSKECLIIMFRGFQVKRFIEIDVINDKIPNDSNIVTSSYNGNNKNNLETMKQIRKRGDQTFVPGVRPVKPPAFIPVKLGNFPIPDKVWSAVLGDSEQTIYGSEYEKILERIEAKLPFLGQDLNIHNYIDKWHNLLYMEEIQANISMRVYDMSKVYLIRCQEYLTIEINGLSERRPSLIRGDRAVVTDSWESNKPQYEGYIHNIKGDFVMMKFNQRFHETYAGGDVSIEFHFSRSIYRRSHQAINLALSNLGPDILFPSRISHRPARLLKEQLANITWFNKKLNDGQKAAVTNILLGECRPLPYCIYGPPGTGKTVTVIELILQILYLLPDSRILVATPSNSASNLITERLINYKNNFSGSMIRLIANYLVEPDNVNKSIPDVIKPFCGTLDIARENTSKSKYTVQNGINLNCQTSFVGRHRVTIGTCYLLGSLAQMGLPKGHFTHIIIDEAGQALEPEIMIPMTFTDKENGQIILAGDPMQLGPVVMSKYCKEFGMDESYLSRMLETYPYQKDYASFKNGFNNKFVTKLNDNYRSLKEVLTLPSEIFYDGSLVPKIDENQQWIQEIINATNEIFDINNDVKTGGIFVHGIKGTNMRAEDSPSWYNPQEASMVALTTCKLYKKNISTDDIGIITPYIAQIKYLRHLFEAMGLPHPKIGTVEEFQGQERPIILISTVRSTESYLQEDKKHTLGFVSSPKRVNVALTRGQVAVIVFCNPHLLSIDNLWKKVLCQAVREEKYVGCDLPFGIGE